MRSQIEIHLVGSGRWARILCRVLLAQAPQAKVTIHSQDHAPAVEAWLRAEKLERLVTLVPGKLSFDAQTGFVVIANAAGNHEETAAIALRAGCPTLVEKPLALSEIGARRLIALANETGASLAVSNVFRFARYVDRFAERARAISPVELAIDWHDSLGEVRYGEVKTYDAAVSLPEDVLPHIVSLLETLLPGTAIQLLNVSVDQGGMLVSLCLQAGNVTCLVSLGRNQPARRRSIRIRGRDGTVDLDFTREPGRILCDGGEESGDAEWANRPSPLAEQIRTFLSGVADNRLSPASALQACRLADSIVPVYEDAQAGWVESRISAGADPSEPGLVYAARERAARSLSLRSR